eukprot:TRINITY_DN1485_c0_g1_i13.p1 TRINITY_DN1485_c0_g1~~TRINITY_DN1485_c0_g1_i13.p1  ORF type:complete len:972 (+),score=239.68 TRINITY_DN1485_c0_g1_i13:41-2956(+)
MSATPSGNPPGELEQMEMVGIETAEPVKNDKMRKTTTWVVIGVVAVAVVAVSGWLFNEHQQRELNSLRRQLHSLEAEVDDFKKALTLVSGMQTPDELTHLIQQASESAIADVSQKVDALASDATDLRSDFQEAKEYINHRDGDLVVFEKKVTDDLAALKRQVPELSALSDEVTALVSNATRREETSVQLHADFQEAKTRISDVEKALTDGLESANIDRDKLVDTFNTELAAFKEEVNNDLTPLIRQSSESLNLIANINEEVSILTLNVSQGDEVKNNLRSDLQDIKTRVHIIEDVVTTGLGNTTTERNNLSEKLAAFKEEVTVDLAALTDQVSESASLIADITEEVNILSLNATQGEEANINLRADLQDAKTRIESASTERNLFNLKLLAMGEDVSSLIIHAQTASASSSLLTQKVDILALNVTQGVEASADLHSQLQDAKNHIGNVEKAVENANTERNNLAETINSELRAFEEDVSVDVATLTQKASESSDLIAGITQKVDILALNVTQGVEASADLHSQLQDAKTHITNVDEALTAGLENANTERGNLVETFNTKLTAFEEEVKKEVTSELQPLPYVCLVDGGVNEGNAWKLDSTDSIWVPAGDPYPHHLPKKGLLEFRLRVTEAAPRTGRILNVGRFDVHISPVGILVDRLADGSLFVEVRSVNQYANVTVSTSGAEQFVQIAFTEQSFTLYIDGVVVAAPAAGFTSQASLSYSQDPAAPNTFVGYVCYLENKFKDAFWKRMMMNRVIKSRGYESDTTRKVSVMQLTDGTAITSKWKQLVAGDTVGSGNSGASIVDDWELFVHLSDFGNVGSAWMGDQSVSVDTNLFKVGGGLLSETVSSLSTQISSLESETTSHSTQISSLESETTSHSTQISSLESETTSHSKQISSLESQTSSQSSQITSIIGDLRSGCELHYLEWTGEVNNYDREFKWECPHNYFVIGVGGGHDYRMKDLQFIFKCATVKCSRL